MIPPLAWNWNEYGLFCVPFGNGEVLTSVNVGQVIEKLSGLVVVAATASVTLKVTETELRVVGVPLITPVEVFRLRPVGKVPALIVHVYGEVPPVA